MPRLLLAFLAATLPASLASADEGGRHLFELAVGGGMSWQSLEPTEVDVEVGGALQTRVMVDVVHARAEGRFLIVDPSRPELFDIRADARLLFVTVHDFTWRRTSQGELLRLFAGLGGDIDIGDHFHLMLNLGFAMTRLGGFDGLERQLTETYGAYAGVVGRLHIGPVRDELRLAGHAMMQPPELSFELALAPETIFDELEGGLTASNRLYVEALREGVISIGPELFFSVEQLVGGPVFQGTLGVSGTLGI